MSGRRFAGILAVFAAAAGWATTVLSCGSGLSDRLPPDRSDRWVLYLATEMSGGGHGLYWAELDRESGAVGTWQGPKLLSSGLVPKLALSPDGRDLYALASVEQFIVPARLAARTGEPSLEAGIAIGNAASEIIVSADGAHVAVSKPLGPERIYLPRDSASGALGNAVLTAAGTYQKLAVAPEIPGALWGIDSVEDSPSLALWATPATASPASAGDEIDGTSFSGLAVLEGAEVLVAAYMDSGVKATLGSWLLDASGGISAAAADTYNMTSLAGYDNIYGLMAFPGESAVLLHGYDGSAARFGRVDLGGTGFANVADVALTGLTTTWGEAVTPNGRWAYV
ncbi:MAG: hypothetical protein IT285_13005, partial [Bdellovibrionales bacterium]|nr:hypothetical protein [Bdellovibrionales bacterium]